MSQQDTFDTEVHPIDIAEQLAKRRDWDFSRQEENQINLAVAGQWSDFMITLSWSGIDETLRMMCSYEIKAPEERLTELHELLNAINDNLWAGAFTYWKKEGVINYRYGLILAGKQFATESQITSMLATAVQASDKYFPAFKETVWCNKSCEEALKFVIAEPYGRA